MKLAEAYVEIGAKTGEYDRKVVGVRARLSKLGNSFKKMAKRAALAFTAMAVAATYAFAKMIGESVRFEEQLAKVSTMLDKKALPIMDDYRKGIAKMAMEFGQSTETLSAGLYDILSAMVATDQAMGVLEVGARAAVAGFTDTSTTIGTLLTVLKSFKMDASEASEVADKLFTVVARGRTEFAKIAPVLGRATGMAGAAGLSFDELSAALATATRNGLMTEQAITGLMGVARTFLKPQKDAIAAAKEAGFELSKQWLATHSLREAIELINKSRTVSTEQIFAESEAMTVAIAVADDLTGYIKDLEAISKKATGRMEEQFEKAANTMAHQARRIKQGFLEIGKSITTNFMLKMKPLVDEINKRMPQISKAFENVGRAIAEVTEPILKDLIDRLRKLDAKDIQKFANDSGIALLSLGRILLETIRLITLIPTGFEKIKAVGLHLGILLLGKELENLQKIINETDKSDKARIETLEKMKKVVWARRDATIKSLDALGKTEEAMARFEKVLNKSEDSMDKWQEKFSKTIGKDKKDEVTVIKEILDKATSEIESLIKDESTLIRDLKGILDEASKELVSPKFVSESKKQIKEIMDYRTDLNADTAMKEIELNEEVNKRKRVQWFSLADIWTRAMEAATKEEEKIKLPGAKEAEEIAVAQKEADKLLKEQIEEIVKTNKLLAGTLTVEIAEAQMS